MTADELRPQVEQIVTDLDLGRPTARRRGRNHRFPWVPVVAYSDSTGAPRTRQVLARAFATREEAVADAERHIEQVRRRLLADLLRPNKRALREWHGLPRELDPAQTP